MDTYIYALVDPMIKEIKYVGKSNSPKSRFSQHIYKSKCNNYISKKNNWVKELLSLGERPMMEILSVVDICDWESAEKEWISYLRSIGCILFNLMDGGNGKTITSDKTKAIKSAQMKGRVVSRETREKLRMANLGKKLSAETRAKLSVIHKGKIHGKEWRNKLSKSTMGNKRCLGRKQTLRQRTIVYNKSCKLKPSELYEIRELLSKGVYQKDIAKKYGVTQATISQIKLGKTHKGIYENIHLSS